nr:MAG TPA: hypothetical protein [Caudoviricetes sp.]
MCIKYLFLDSSVNESLLFSTNSSNFFVISSILLACGFI